MKIEFLIISIYLFVLFLFYFDLKKLSNIFASIGDVAL